ncbi:hypothetical protein HI914_03583 [Erysiphe necator]|nr:hypothetical protein HI914_03583 [Erysiphe necator]
MEKGLRFDQIKAKDNKLVWLLEGGRFLILPNITLYQNTRCELCRKVDLRLYLRSLPTENFKVC